MINKLPTWLSKLKIRTKVGIIVLLVFFIIFVIFFLLAAPQIKEALDFRETALKQIKDLRSNNIIGYTTDINPNIMKDFLITSADKDQFILILQNIKPVKMNHPYPISGCEIKTNSLNPRIRIAVRISVMDDKVVPYISIDFENNNFSYPYLDGSSEELKKLFRDKNSEILALYNSYISK